MNTSGLTAHSSRLTRILFCTVLLVPLALYAAPPKSELLHKPAPAFTRTDIAGNSVGLSNYRGKVVLLNFWATWCAPCQQELPRFEAWQKQYGASGFQVIAISMEDDPGPVQATARKLQLDFPVIMGDAEIGNLYGGVLGLPVTYLIGRDGTILARIPGQTNLRALHNKIRKLLAIH